MTNSRGPINRFKRLVEPVDMNKVNPYATPPEEILNNGALKFWEEHMPYVYENGLLNEGTIYNFIRLCILATQLDQISDRFLLIGMTYKTKTGYDRISANTKLYFELNKHVQQLSEKFALTPNSRLRMGIPEKEIRRDSNAAEDPWSIPD